MIYQSQASCWLRTRHEAACTGHQSTQCRTNVRTICPVPPCPGADSRFSTNPPRVPDTYRDSVGLERFCSLFSPHAQRGCCDLAPFCCLSMLMALHLSLNPPPSPPLPQALSLQLFSCLTCPPWSSGSGRGTLQPGGSLEPHGVAW